MECCRAIRKELVASYLLEHFGSPSRLPLGRKSKSQGQQEFPFLVVCFCDGSREEFLGGIELFAFQGQEGSSKYGSRRTLVGGLLSLRASCSDDFVEQFLIAYDGLCGFSHGAKRGGANVERAGSLKELLGVLLTAKELDEPLPHLAAGPVGEALLIELLR